MIALSYNSITAAFIDLICYDYNRQLTQPHCLQRLDVEQWLRSSLLPSRFLNHDMDYPFGDLAYADMMDMVARFDMQDQRDLVGIYKHLIGNGTLLVQG